MFCLSDSLLASHLRWDGFSAVAHSQVFPAAPGPGQGVAEGGARQQVTVCVQGGPCLHFALLARHISAAHLRCGQVPDRSFDRGRGLVLDCHACSADRGSRCGPGLGRFGSVGRGCGRGLDRCGNADQDCNLGLMCGRCGTFCLGCSHGQAHARSYSGDLGCTLYPKCALCCHLAGTGGLG